MAKRDSAEVSKVLELIKPTRISLRSHPNLDERWLQKQISEDPSILGLGELTLLQRERIQPSGGRLDLLLEDDNSRRFEVEIQLGATDPSHVIRTIEYWDNERRRYPSYEHYAVLIAEDITSRFLNVVGLFSGSIPIIAIQMNAMEYEGSIILNFTKVIDYSNSLRVDDVQERDSEPKDRNYWLSRASEDSLRICDGFLEMVNQFVKNKRELNYQVHHIGLKDGNRSALFIHFNPRKKWTTVKGRTADLDKWIKEFEDAGLDSKPDRGNFLQVNVRPHDLKKHEELFRRFVEAMVNEDEGR